MSNTRNYINIHICGVISILCVANIVIYSPTTNPIFHIPKKVQSYNGNV